MSKSNYPTFENVRSPIWIIHLLSNSLSLKMLPFLLIFIYKISHLFSYRFMTQELKLFIIIFLYKFFVLPARYLLGYDILCICLMDGWKLTFAFPSSITMFTNMTEIIFVVKLIFVSYYVPVLLPCFISLVSYF